MKQQRNTKQRQTVLHVVKTRQDHPTADQIYLDVRALDARISRGTVYRNLHILAEDGEILHIQLIDINRFDRRTDIHYHMLCKKCRTVSDAPLDYLHELDEQIAKKTGYAISRHRMIFEGICPECMSRQEP